MMLNWTKKPPHLSVRLPITRTPSIPSILIALVLIALPIPHAKGEPLDEVVKSKQFRTVLGRRKDKTTSEKTYTKQWFNPGSFYGQLFLQPHGYQLLFDWLSLPRLKFSPVDTKHKKAPEYLRVTRSYLDEMTKPVSIKILVPHPRSAESIKQGLVAEFENIRPSVAEIYKETDLPLGDKKASLIELENGQCIIIYDAAMGTKIEARVDNCKQQEVLIAFFKELNLDLLNQRLQS